MELGQAWTAFGYGILSAVSLPLGALVGLWLNPSKKWTSSLMSFGAGALLAALSPSLFVFVEGLAAGAMLAMIAETMLPEAAEQGGPATGLMTVMGFLAAIYVGTLNPGH